VVSAYHLFFDGGLFENASRTPGYPVFLAAIVGLGGPHAMGVMMGAQHLLAATVSIFVVKIGDELDPSRRLGFLAGVLSAFSLQFQSYASFPMTEVLFGFLCTAGLFCTLRYVNANARRMLILAALAFSTATLVRPSGQYLPLLLLALAAARLVRPPWHYLRPARTDRAPERLRMWAPLAGAGLVTFTVVSPWMFYNQARVGHFSLGGTFGLNLYSNTVEYGNFWDAESRATKDIQARWNEWEATRVARGEPAETQYTWRNHWPAMGHYTSATGDTIWDADTVFRQAAIDAVAAHPREYARHVLRNVFMLLYHPEPTYRYVPGVREGVEPPFPLTFAWPPEALEPHRAAIADVVAAMGHGEGNSIRFFEPTKFTIVYGWLAAAYHAVMAKGGWLVVLFVVGWILMTARSFGANGLVWLTVLAYVAYLVFVPMLVVPWSPRHRLPADPAIAVLYALALFAIARGLLATGSILRNRLSNPTAPGLLGVLVANPMPRLLPWIERVGIRRLQYWVLVFLVAILIALALWHGGKGQYVSALVGLLALLL